MEKIVLKFIFERVITILSTLIWLSMFIYWIFFLFKIINNDVIISIGFVFITFFNIIFIIVLRYLFFFSGLGYINNFGIGLKNFFGEYFIEWDKVKKVYTCFRGFRVFEGEKKRLSIPNYFPYSGYQAIKFYRKLDEELKTRKIIVNNSVRAMFPQIKNCKK